MELKVLFHSIVSNIWMTQFTMEFEVIAIAQHLLIYMKLYLHYWSFPNLFRTDFRLAYYL